MDNFQKKFIEEATDLINTLEESLLALDSNPDDKQIIADIFRVMHSLKGGGAMFGFENISEFTHNLETIYDFVRNDKMPISQDLLDVTFHSIDLLRAMLNREEEENPEIKASADILMQRVQKIISQAETGHFSNAVQHSKVVENQENKEVLKTFAIHFSPNEDIFDNGTNPLFLIEDITTLGKYFIFPHLHRIPELENFDVEKCYISWDILLSTSKNIEIVSDIFIFVEGDCVLEIEKISDSDVLENQEFMGKIRNQNHQIRIHFKEILLQNNSQDLQNESVEFVQTQEKIESTENIHEKIRIFSKESVIASVRVPVTKLDQLMNLVSELVTTQASLSMYVEKHSVHELTQISENIENITRQLRDNAFTMSLVPIEAMLTRFHRLVRDLSALFKKDIAFITEGAETELDKTLIQTLTEPLMHIIRNSIDHGIETIEERIRLGKPKQGKIVLKAYYSGSNVHIQVRDDGRGIDSDKVKRKAIEKGLIHPDMVLSERETLDLIFLPGFSTADAITDISGRGVGMDVVKRKISEMRGEVEISSNIHQGTSITLKLPLTLSIIDGLLCKVGETFYIIPLSVVEKIYSVEHSKLVNTFNNLIILDGEQIPFYYLREEFCESGNFSQNEEIVVVRYEEKQIGLAVDAVVGEYQAVLKTLGRLYKNQEIVSGASILGDGTVALVLDTNKIISQFSNQMKY